MKMTLVTLLGLLALPLAAEELSGTVTEPACALILEQVNPSDLVLGVSGCRIDQNAGGVFPFMVKLQRRDQRGGNISESPRTSQHERRLEVHLDETFEGDTALLEVRYL
ncbi:hypothetical protein [Aeromonas schubertii]|uniref:hypothetical protein n=1 Tax=Aeromonas schubertii TaxID=652 RepID=UPI0010A7622F|nr:hypothetical protein [Aeromonas schubertii]QCG46809.1 hypothetical protein E2P79_02110 [Aeromonas schubertii]